MMIATGMIFAGAGCGGSKPTPGSAESALTVDAWKALPPGVKFEIATLERLKEGEPKLREHPAWNKFTREVILPAKRKEMPAGPPKS